MSEDGGLLNSYKIITYKIPLIIINMQCERLIKLIKSWYLHVQGETMAPARMVSFMKRHAKSCEICLQDADLKEEIAKITEIVLPESKIPKAIRQKNERAAQEEAEKENTKNEENDDEDTELDEEEGEGEDEDTKLDTEDGGEETKDEDTELDDEEGGEEKEDEEEGDLIDDPKLLPPPDA